MIISHKHKFIFIKTRKTAGTSIEIALSQFCGPEDIITKISPNDELIRKNLGYPGPQNFKQTTSYFDIKYWLRLLKVIKLKPGEGQHSPASFIKTYIGDNIWDQYFKFSFERNPFDKAISYYYWDTREMSSPPEINSFIRNMRRAELSNWKQYSLNNQVAINYLGKYETLKEDLSAIQKKIGLPDFSLPNAKSSMRKNRQHYSQILNPQSRKHIEKICANEIEFFKYYWVSQ
jgi:hypothetical protein